MYVCMYVCKNYLNEVGYASTINTGLHLKHHTCIHTCIHTSNMHTYSYQWSDRVDGQIHTNRFLANMSGEYFFIAYAVVSDENHSLLHTLAVKHRQARGRLLENCRRQYWIAFRCLVEREVLPWIVLNSRLQFIIVVTSENFIAQNRISFRYSIEYSSRKFNIIRISVRMILPS